MESLRTFHQGLKLDELDDAWVRSIWDSELITYDEPPDEYAEHLDSEEARLLLRESRRALATWIATMNGCEEPPEYSWQALMVLNINVRGLLATLGYIMRTGQRTGTDDACKQACLEATSLYFMLLAIPGSNAFGIYHPNLYRRAIETLKMSEGLLDVPRRRNSEVDAIGCDVDEDFSPNHYVPSYVRRSWFVKGLDRIISDLITMLRSFRLKEHPDALDVTVHTLLDVTRLEMCLKFDNGIESLSRNAYAALRELCANSHGTVGFTVMLIVQYMLPHLLFHQQNSQPKSTVAVHEATVYFLRSLLKSHGEEAAQGIITLMHQLMMQCPERLEGRQKQAVILIKLLQACNKDVIATIFRDLISFSYNGKIACRLFAQEIVGKLLTECSLSKHDLDEDTRIRIRRILVALVSSRCIDRSPLVRGKAMATLASFSDCHDDLDKSILESILDGSTPRKELTALDDLKRALSGDIDPLPGSEAFVAMLLERVNDERALVRRNALKILRNLSVMFPLFARKTTRLISDRCRDPTLIVRQFAVHVLSEILERFPQDSSLLDEWTLAVVPQIYDIETKVQEKVLECLRSLVIGRITSASTYVPDAASGLPWKILNRLSEMRMRKHLSKACSLWAKNGLISRSVISNLQSHIGTDNSVAAWILLAALAENTRIPDVDRHVADYKEIIQKNDFHASLVLQVLRHTWSTLDRDYLEDLHRHLYRCVRLFEINFNLISICLDIVNGVLRHLHATDESSLIESNMIELMRASEAQIQNFLNENEVACTLQDTLIMRAIFTLGHASLLCTNRISWSTLRLLERLLLHWETLPASVREIKNLQGSVVVLLCQQALRDREIAKEITPILGNLMRQETSSDDSPTSTAVKINAAKALADICVRFTALVEPYLPDMCISMKDSNPTVREAIVVIFIQLLLEDFIKMKGPFFFHILTMLSDPDGMIRELTIFLIEERLLVKNKNLISQQFLESIYHYNNYWSVGTFRGHRMDEREKKLLTLPGRANAAKRNVIYEFMVEHLDASAKLELLVKLTKYILREISDGDSVDVTSEEGACVLQDAVFIVGNSRLQASSLSCEKHRDDMMPEFDETTTSSVASSNERAATNAIVATMRKHHLDNLLPTLILLKKKLAAVKSFLEDDVESLLFKIYSEYEKEHLLNLLNEYPELEKEMDRYQRRLKDRRISESDDGKSVTSSCTVLGKDSLLKFCNKRSPRVLLHRLSSRTLSNDGAIDPNNDTQQITASYDMFSKHPARLERLLLTPTPPPEPSFDMDTRVSTRTLDSCSDVSRARGTPAKKPASEEVFPDNIRVKLSRVA